MYLDFEDLKPETPHLERAISLREGVLLSVIAHLAFLLALIMVPQLPWVQAAAARAREAALQKQLEMEQNRQARFVFVEPRLDVPSPKPPPRAELSDQDRVAQTLRRAPEPNSMPYARGNSSERVEAAEQERARGRGDSPEPSQVEAASQPAPAIASGTPAYQAPRTETARSSTATPGGSLGEALRNLQRYTQNQSFDNPSGGDGKFGPAIQFDTKGVEFGPWIRRFIAQIKRNWFIPYAAMSLRGHVVLTFNVHKDGRITDLTVQMPSNVDSFNNAAYNALFASNPTQELPPEYPSDKAFFTVTFYYNESPPD